MSYQQSVTLNHETPRGAALKGGLRRGGGATSGLFQQKKSVPFQSGTEGRSSVVHNYLRRHAS